VQEELDCVFKLMCTNTLRCDWREINEEAFLVPRPIRKIRAHGATFLKKTYLINFKLNEELESYNLRIFYNVQYS
jgi:hypothetical protein